MFIMQQAHFQDVDDYSKLMEKYSASPFASMVNISESIPLCPAFFEDELHAGLAILNCDDYVSYRDAGKVVSLCLYPLQSLLERYNACNPQGAQEAAKRIINILENLDTDDDFFPFYHIEMLQKEYDLM